MTTPDVISPDLKTILRRLKLSTFLVVAFLPPGTRRPGHLHQLPHCMPDRLNGEHAGAKNEPSHPPVGL